MNDSVKNRSVVSSQNTSVINEHTTRETMYVKHDIEARSCSHCCNGKGIIITYSERVANLYDIYHCCMYSEKLLIMDRGTVRNM